jgi:hypothetical protein
LKPQIIHTGQPIKGFPMRIIDSLKRVLVAISANKQRLAILGVGVLANQVFVYSFNYGIYPLVIYHYGPFKGYFIMVALSAIVCYLTILFYDWLKKDFLGIETIKEIKEYEGQHRTARFISSILKKSDLLAFLFLSIKYDPFITVVYMRKGAHKYDGLTKREWKIFTASLLVGDIYWTIVVFFSIQVITNAKAILKFIM